MLDTDSSTGNQANAPRDAAAVFSEAVAIMARLRGPDGCPWDREQDFESIRKHTIEEAYEVLDAIERRHWSDLKEELGDLLLQVLFYSQMASEAGFFSVGDVVEGLNRKLVRRHPHVFGDAASAQAGNAAGAGLPARDIDAPQVLRNWDAIKAAEKRASEQVAGEKGGPGTAVPESRLDSIPRKLPALMEAGKLGSRAAKSGFDWPNVDDLFAKIEEEVAELQEAIAADPSRPGSVKAISGEVGDLLFTVVNLARHLNVDSELALRQTNGKFRCRFASMEQRARQPLEALDGAQLEELWSEAKRLERDDE